MAHAIEFDSLEKTFGKHKAVEGLTATVYRGRVTGFLGPNGAGKSTTLRCLVGLSSPDKGSAKIFGKNYQDLENPLSLVGAVLDTRGFHTALTGEQNLKVVAAATGLPDSRVAEVLELVELTHAAKKRVKQYSLGMKQRLALAGAILGDPELLILDEPANGLDPAGIAWLRNFLRSRAQEGKTILVSSHQLAEMQHTIDDVLIIHQGKLIASGAKESVMGDGTLEDAFLKLTEGRLS
jgi:ABC-2 type transport system ATP-binding protein